MTLISVELTCLMDAGAYPIDIYKPIVWDLRTGREITDPGAIFRLGAHYAHEVYNYCCRQWGDGNGPDKSEAKDFSWAITRTGIVVYYDFSPHAVAGLDRNFVPWSALQSVLKLGGLGARLVAERATVSE
jgi:hypothetical protein